MLFTKALGQLLEKSFLEHIALITRKAEEYLRLSQVKCAGLSARTTETSNAVMCLDLAASCMKRPLDKVSGRLRMSDPAHQGLITHFSF